jgi:hypothetical protein
VKRAPASGGRNDCVDTDRWLRNHIEIINGGLTVLAELSGLMVCSTRRDQKINEEGFSQAIALTAQRGGAARGRALGQLTADENLFPARRSHWMLSRAPV